jgi:flagellar hook-basal body complex protein FliE
MPEFAPYVSLANINSPIYAGGKVAGNIFSATPPAVTDDGFSFEDVLNDAISNIEELNQVKDADSANLAIGDMDDLAAMMINSQRADSALTMIVELRNRLLEGYNEIMRTNL